MKSPAAGFPGRRRGLRGAGTLPSRAPDRQDAWLKLWRLSGSEQSIQATQLLFRRLFGTPPMVDELTRKLAVVDEVSRFDFEGDSWI